MQSADARIKPVPDRSRSIYRYVDLARVHTSSIARALWTKDAFLGCNCIDFGVDSINIGPKCGVIHPFWSSESLHANEVREKTTHPHKSWSGEFRFTIVINFGSHIVDLEQHLDSLHQDPQMSPIQRWNCTYKMVEEQSIQLGCIVIKLRLVAQSKTVEFHGTKYFCNIIKSFFKQFYS